MSERVPAVLAVCVLLGLGLWWRYSKRDALMGVLIGGWLVLPIAPFPLGVFGQPVGNVGSMHALAVPTPVLANRATAIGLVCWLGVLGFAGTQLRSLRVAPLDLPILVWCGLPVVSALANGLGLAEGLAQVRYLVLAWGGPYLAGRVLLGDDAGLARFGRGLVVAGLVTGLGCALEIVTGPWLYRALYGPHPYQTEGMVRPVLFRPLLLMEHGNQLGMWTATTAIAAVWLWRAGRLGRVAGMPAGAVAAVLVANCVICQSHGAIALMAVVVAGLLLTAGGWRRRSWAVVVGLVVGIGSLATPPPAAGGVSEQVRDLFREAGKSSVNWRLARSFEYLPRVLERPALGWGTADWSAAPEGTFVNPVNLGLWLMAAGQLGVVGLIALTLVLTLPIVEVLRWLPPRAWLNPGCAGVALMAVLLAVNALDAVINSVYLLPLLAGAGGITTWSQGRYDGR